MGRQIVLATRFGESARETAQVAGDLARLAGGGITIVYVATELAAVAMAGEAGVHPEAERQRLLESIHDQLDAFVQSSFQGQSVDVRVVEGDIAEAVTEVAAESDAAYLVVGTRGRNRLARLILGDTTQSILQHATCPVVVVPLGMTATE